MLDGIIERDGVTSKDDGHFSHLTDVVGMFIDTLSKFTDTKGAVNMESEKECCFYCGRSDTKTKVVTVIDENREKHKKRLCEHKDVDVGDPCFFSFMEDYFLCDCCWALQKGSPSHKDEGDHPLRCDFCLVHDAVQIEKKNPNWKRDHDVVSTVKDLQNKYPSLKPPCCFFCGSDKKVEVFTWIDENKVKHKKFSCVSDCGTIRDDIRDNFFNCDWCDAYQKGEPQFYDEHTTMCDFCFVECAIDTKKKKPDLEQEYLFLKRDYEIVTDAEELMKQHPSLKRLREEREQEQDNVEQPKKLCCSVSCNN